MNTSKASMTLDEETAAGTARRVVITAPPFTAFGVPDAATPWNAVPQWPARWIRLDPLPPAPFVAAYRLDFEVATASRFRAHVSGDERYELFLDGERVARGPARSPAGWWYFETLDFELPAGRHSLAARVCSLGKMAPWAQLSFAHGFLFAPDDEEWWDVLATGRAAWRCQRLPGFTFTAAGAEHGGEMGCGAVVDLDGSLLDWDWLRSDYAHWSDPAAGADGNSGFTLYIKPHIPWLRPSELPAPLDQPVFPPTAKVLAGHFSSADFLDLNIGKRLVIPAQQKVRVVFDWRNYFAAYPGLEVSGGKRAVIRLGWCEAPAGETGEKVDRSAPKPPDAYAGDGLLECFAQPYAGVFDTFRPDGGPHRFFEPLWWRCGRFVVLEIETADSELVLEALQFRETRLPLDIKATWQAGNAPFTRMLSLCQRTLELCAHETFMDCPFWEQLQYAGDTRIQALLSYVLAGSDVLARRALRAFDASRRNRSGWPGSSHPARAHQSLPPFALAWVGILHDFALWRGDQDFVREIMPAARAATELWVAQRRPDQLIANPAGWNFLEWSGDLGNLRGPVHGAPHWLLAGALRQIAELEIWLGEAEFAARASRLAGEVAAAAERFWSESRQLYADDLEHTRFSEHTNAFAILSGLLPKARCAAVADALFGGSQELTRTQIYGSHFLFEAAAQCGRMEIFEERLAPWLALAGQGYVTTPETFGETRSECHAWGAHPLFHLFASMGGVRPASFGFETVSFRPQPGSLKAATLVMPHPRGTVRVAWSEQAAPRVTLPTGVTVA